MNIPKPLRQCRLAVHGLWTGPALPEAAVAAVTCPDGDTMFTISSARGNVEEHLGDGLLYVMFAVAAV